MTSSSISFTVASAATACLVDQKTIRRRLDQLEQHGAAKSDDGQWAIPLAALLAVGLQPGRPAGPDVSMDSTEMSNGHVQDNVQGVSTPTQAELEGLRHRLAVVETERDGLRDLVAAERRNSEVLALALRALTAAAPTTTPVPKSPTSGWVAEEPWPATPTSPSPDRAAPESVSWSGSVPPVPGYEPPMTGYGGYGRPDQPAQPPAMVPVSKPGEIHIPRSMRRRWWQRG